MEIGFITYMVSGISFVISFFVIYFYLRTSILKEVKEVSNVFKKARKPKEIIIWDEGREKINS
jgi:heme/copper-type cytochrome/quinol oxidase subunit 3